MIILGVTSSSDKNVPTAPTIGTATNVGTGRAYNNGAATVTFTPTYSGGLPVTYTATSSPGGFTASGSASPLTVTGLQSGVAYTFTVTATNSLGTSAASAASNSITATTVPQAPTIGTATDGGTGTTVSVAFTPGATGGSAITTYTATSSPGSITGTGASSPITVSGLTTGTAYTFTVTATNANGTSTASAASNSVTPQIPGAFDSIASAAPTGTGTVTFSNIPQTFGHLQLRIMARSTQAGFATVNTCSIQINSDSGNNYYTNYIIATGSGTNASNSWGDSSGMFALLYGASSALSNLFGVTVMDIFDYTSTNKRKTIRANMGAMNNQGDANNEVRLVNWTWANTSAITSLTITTNNNFADGTTIALYGIRGS